MHTSHSKEIFGKVPIRLSRDKRVRPNDIRVYIALSSFQGKHDKCFPGRKAIAERSGVHYSHISESTERLVTLGYLTKTRRGKKCSNVYRVKSDDADSATSLRGDDAKSATCDVANSATSIVKEQLKEKREDLPPIGSSQKKNETADRFVRWYAVQHDEILGSKYIPQAGDCSLVEGLLHQLDEAELKRRGTRFLSMNDKFLSKAGHGINIFAKQINSLGQGLPSLKNRLLKAGEESYK